MRAVLSRTLELEPRRESTALIPPPSRKRRSRLQSRIIGLHFYKSVRGVLIGRRSHLTRIRGHSDTYVSARARVCYFSCTLIH